VSLRVLLVDQQPDRASAMERTLRADGYEIAGRVTVGGTLMAEVKRLKPDVIVVDLDSPDRDSLEAMRMITRDQPKPIVMFVDQSDSDSIAQAIKAGVAAYVVDDVSPQRVRPIVEVAIAQFQEFQALRTALDETRATLAERKTVERAKGLLMQQKGCSEEEAYRDMRKMAMDRNMRLVEVAESVLAIAKLLGR
jgi:response regulator NasT